LHSAKISQTRQMNGSTRRAQKAPRLQPKTSEINGSTRQALKAPNPVQQRTPLHHLWCRLRKMKKRLRIETLTPKSTTLGSTTTRAARAQRKYPISRGNGDGYPCRHRHASFCDRAVNSSGSLAMLAAMRPGALRSDDNLLFVQLLIISWVFLCQLSHELVAQFLGQVESGKLPTPL
jgi:hypothetical protein